MSDQPRAVFVTEQQRRALGSLEDFLDPDGPHFAAVEAMRRAWDAAPADPAEAVREALAPLSELDRHDLQGKTDLAGKSATSVLRALGFPERGAP